MAMNQHLINEFNKDLQHGAVICIFEEPDLWDELLQGGIYEEGPFGDIEVDVLSFLETHPKYDYFDIPSRNFESINLQGHELTYEISFTVDLPEAKVGFNWDDVGEDEEPEEELVDIQGVAIVTARYENWKINSIHCFITSGESEEDRAYELWPNNEMPDRFGGEWGMVEESLSDFEWKHLTSLLEVKMSTLDRQFHIDKWNAIQKDLWLKTCNKIKCDKNDVSKFIKFGKFFYDFVNKNDETPTVNQILKVIK